MQITDANVRELLSAAIDYRSASMSAFDIDLIIESAIDAHTDAELEVIHISVLDDALNAGIAEQQRLNDLMESLPDC